MLKSHILVVFSFIASYVMGWVGWGDGAVGRLNFSLEDVTSVDQKFSTEGAVCPSGACQINGKQ